VSLHAAMVGHLDTTAEQQSDAEQLLGDLRDVRRRTLALVAHLRPSELEATHSPIMSPLVWDLAHIAAYEDLWLVHRHADEPLLHPELAAMYDAFETPRIVRGDLELLDAAQALRYLADVRERSARASREHGIGDGFVHEMVLRHELQHTETMLQTMAIAALLPPRDVIDPTQAAEWNGTAHVRAAQARPVSDWVEVPRGRFPIGAPEGRFSYDNERPRHDVELDSFAIAATPVSNRQWREFYDQGGYEQRQHWSPEGWSWRQDSEPLADPSAGAGAGDQPVCHLCFHEAEAFCRWRGARLPSEAEWEAAAAHAGAELHGRGQVWEWTSSELDGYPGFVAHPYREYSEVFFGRGYRVLRGGSWATDRRVATLSFRNWDLPTRRQIFAGVRLATDL
jgi:gamma-glutamyl hercynylcysteine S-oxide synthase